MLLPCRGLFLLFFAFFRYLKCIVLAWVMQFLTFIGDIISKQTPYFSGFWILNVSSSTMILKLLLQEFYSILLDWDLSFYWLAFSMVVFCATKRRFLDENWGLYIFVGRWTNIYSVVIAYIASIKWWFSHIFWYLFLTRSG